MTSLNAALASIDAFIEREMAFDGPPGLALAITDPERTLATRTYGYANLDARAPIEPHHLFQTASTGKSFAALIVMQEVEASRIRLDVPVTEYLPWFRVPSRFGDITLFHLMTHTAGISTGGEGSPGADGEVWALRDSEAAWAAGTRFWYSNAGWKAVGLVLERVIGKPYAQIVRERIFEPLGMDSSVGAITNDIRPRSAVGYKRLYDDRVEHRSQPWVPAPFSESTSADGSLCLTVEDMAAYERMLLNRGRGPSGPIVSRESFDHLARPFIADPDSPTDWYGAGFYTRTEGGRDIFGHSGGVLGFTTGMWTENGLGVVILQNSERGAWWATPYVLAAARAGLDGREIPEPPPAADPTVTLDVADYAGIFRGEGRELELVADGNHLSLDGVALERVDGDTFLAPHPEFGRFFLRFSREGGQVVSVAHGPDRFFNSRHSGFVPPSSAPAEWRSYAGHYRSHNPWSPSIRAFVRDDSLYLAFSNVDFDESEFELQPLPNGKFRMGDTPEQIGFDTVINGVTHRAVLMNQEHFRTFTP